MAVGARNPVAQAIEQIGFERLASGRQVQQPLTPVAGAYRLRDEPPLLKLAKNPAERLFGDRQKQQQVADGQAGTPCDKIERAVVRATETMRSKPDIGTFDHIGIAKVEQLDPATDFSFTQEKRRCASCQR